MKFKVELDPLKSMWINIISSDLGSQINRMLANQVTSLAHNTKRSETKRSGGRTKVETNSRC